MSSAIEANFFLYRRREWESEKGETNTTGKTTEPFEPDDSKKVTWENLIRVRV